MNKLSLEKPYAVFCRVPQIEDICIEFGVDRDDALFVTCMYELYKRCTGEEKYDMDAKSYNDGYREGYNDAIQEAEDKIDSLSWEIGRMKRD